MKSTHHDVTDRNSVTAIAAANLSRRAFGVLAATSFAALGTRTASAQALQEVTIGLGSASLVGGSARIAKELGLFQKQGLDATLVVTDSGDVSLAALMGKSYKIVVCGLEGLLAAKARGQDVLAVVPTYVGLGVNLILAKEVAAKLGVSPTAPLNQRLKALDGVMIGTASPSSVATISLKMAVDFVGGSVRFANMTYPAMVAALETGSIQGFIAGAPFWAQPIVSGKAIQWINVKIELPPQFLPAMSAVLATRRDVADSEPELVKKVAAALGDLAKAVQERPNDVKAAMAKLYPNFDEAMIKVLFEAEAGSWKSAPVTAEEITQEISYLKASGLAPPDIDKVTSTSMLFYAAK